MVEYKVNKTDIKTRQTIYRVVGVIMVLYGIEQYLANIFLGIKPLIPGIMNWTLTVCIILFGLYLTFPQTKNKKNNKIKQKKS